jgi:hypothetical protein
MTTYKQNRNFIICVLVALALLFIGGWYISGKKNQFNEKDLIIKALQSGIKKTIDKQGRETAEKQILITTIKQLKAAHVSDSSTIGRLQKLVDKRTTSAAIIKNHTSGSLTGKNPTVTFGNKTDSLTKITQPDSCNPIYQDTLRDGWTEIAIKACKDSTHADYTVRNEYEQTQGLGDLQGKFPFRYRAPVMKIKNLNPHTKTDEINAWAVQVPNIKKKVTIAAGVGAAAGLILGIFLTR